MKRVISKEIRVELSEREAKRLFQIPDSGALSDAKVYTSRGVPFLALVFRRHEANAEQSVDLLMGEQIRDESAEAPRRCTCPLAESGSGFDPQCLLHGDIPAR